MPAFLVGGVKPRAVYVGGVKAKKIMVGTGTAAVQVWADIAPQGMRPTEDNPNYWTQTYNKWAKALLMAADPAYPGSVVVDDELVIVGSGSGRVEIGVRWQNAGNNTGCRLVHNGVVGPEFWADDKKQATGSIPGVTVEAGDRLTLEIRQGYGANRYYADSTYLRFIPD